MLFDDKHRNTNAEAVVVGISILSFLIIILNLIIITTFIVHRRLCNFGDLFILNTCLADLGQGFGLIPQIIFYKQDQVWRAGPELCVLSLLVLWECMIVSILSVSCIFIDRFVCITYPARYRKTQSRWLSALILLCLWLLVFLLHGVSTIVLFRAQTEEGRCNVPYKRDGRAMLSIAALFLVPFFVLPLVTEVVHHNIKKLYVFVDRTKQPSVYNLRREPTKLGSGDDTNEAERGVCPSRTGISKFPSSVTSMGSIKRGAGTRSLTNTRASKSTEPSGVALAGSSKFSSALISTTSSRKAGDVNTPPEPSKATSFHTTTTTKSEVPSKNKSRQFLSAEDSESSVEGVTGSRVVPMSQSKIDQMLRGQVGSPPDGSGDNCCLAYLRWLQPIPQEMDMDTTKRHFSTKCQAKLLRDSRLLWGLVITFITCGVPFAFTLLVRGICQASASSQCPVDNDSGFFEISIWLMQMSAAVHPILFALIHARIRHVLLKCILRCCSRRHRRREDE